MPSLAPQNQDSYAVRSLYDYIADNIAPAYNAAVASSDYPTPLGLALEWPDDPDLAPKMPVIIIEPPEDVGPQVAIGMGDQVVWKKKLFHLYCFPAITTEGKPSLTAASILRTYTDFALGTGLYLPFYDYSQNPKVQIDTMEVLDSRQIKGFKSFAPLLAIEKHRYDYLLTVRYQVPTING